MIIEIFETDYSSSCFLLNEIQIVILTLRCPKDENRIELTPNGIIDKLMDYDDYIADEKIAGLKEKIYRD